MAAKVTLVRAKDVLAKHLERPEFRSNWEQSALARAVAIAIVDYRSKHQLTQTLLARRLGVRQPHVARLETGEHTPSLEMLQRLSGALGLRFVVDVAPVRHAAPKRSLRFPRGVRVMEDVVARGSRVRVAAG